jgi:integrase
MAIRKLTDGSKKPWFVECYPFGREGPRKRKRFATRGEAIHWENELLTMVPPEESDERRLSSLIERWFILHGQSLKDGEARLSKLLHIAESMNDPIAKTLSAKDFAIYREKRLSGELPNLRASRTANKGVTPVSVNRDHSYLRAVFNELSRLGEWTYPNPLENLRAFRQSETELSYLNQDEIQRLLQACSTCSSPDLLWIVKLCLSTGARWSEIEEIKASQIATDRVTFIKTKSNKSRTIPVDPQLIAQVPIHRGRIFSNSYHFFAKALKIADIQLPTGQRTHVLRHTFASHFMMNGGNILVLQKILGHSTINMTMRYAHFAPDHLKDALRFNPLSNLKHTQEQ